MHPFMLNQMKLIKCNKLMAKITKYFEVYVETCIIFTFIITCYLFKTTHLLLKMMIT